MNEPNDGRRSMTPAERNAVGGKICSCGVPRVTTGRGSEAARRIRFCMRCDAPPNPSLPPLYADPATWELNAGKP